MPRENRDILTGGRKYAQKQAKKHRVEEVVFDKDARVEYLTGFHKRKLARQKHAKEFIEEQERKNRLEERARIRQERKDKVQQRLQELQQLKDGGQFVVSESESEGENDDAPDSSVTDEEVKDNEDEESEWTGFSEDFKKKKSRGILKRKQVYVATDANAPVVGETVVTVEAIDNGNPIEELAAIAKANQVDLTKSESVLNDSLKRARQYARLVVGHNDSEEESDTDSNKRPKKPKKKKFRYLSKSERKTNRFKEKSKKRAQRDRD
ncbi:unnamed protein product [Kuraishia capsulata CBS 1993]|uniref:Ribosomal RNA-processing protein 17 n=1 Tax=Kuraishia capsulata CBS 1993 TaxID=1382522 RepID=W6MK02_9ASCO|nr:uncharacterized protein KUCA_T00000859001 [Kuraishia capsulata CBS 1993]CDK24892.1 unnamed protein product [Kuraishia capsulata CBS 1993]